jgi:WD40 repeat protein
VQHSPDYSRWFVVEKNENGSALRAYSTKNGSLLAEFDELTKIPFLKSVRASHDGKKLLSTHNSHELMIWNSATGQRLQTLRHADKPSLHFQRAVFSPDGVHVLAADDTGDWSLWNVSSGQLERELKGHLKIIAALDYASDGKTFATASFDGTLKVWGAPSGHLLWTSARALPAQSRLLEVRYSPDSTRIAVGSKDGRLRLFDAMTGQLLRESDDLDPQDLHGRMESLAFSPDGLLLASAGSDGLVKLWNAETLQRLFNVEDEQGRPDAQWVEFTPAGEALVAASADGHIKVWRLMKERSVAVTTEDTP